MSRPYSWSFTQSFIFILGISWSWLYGSWIYNCLCNQCLSPSQARCTTLCDKVCQWLATGLWFSSGTLVSSTNKTDHHDIAEILLRMALNIINQTVSDLSQVEWSLVGVSEWLLFNDNSAIFQPYHGENKFIFNEMMMRFAFVLDQHA